MVGSLIAMKDMQLEAARAKAKLPVARCFCGELANSSPAHARGVPDACAKPQAARARVRQLNSRHKGMASQARNGR